MSPADPPGVMRVALVIEVEVDRDEWVTANGLTTYDVMPVFEDIETRTAGRISAAIGGTVDVLRIAPLRRTPTMREFADELVAMQDRGAIELDQWQAAQRLVDVVLWADRVTADGGC